MEESLEKRAYERMAIPGAAVVFRRKNRLGLFERFSRPMELYNITKSGICFKSEKKLARGSTLYVDIIIPGEKTLRLIGHVKWIEDEFSPGACLIGAQFYAYGKGKNYNSIKALERLRKLHDKYSNFQA